MSAPSADGLYTVNVRFMVAGEVGVVLAIDCGLGSFTCIRLTH